MQNFSYFTLARSSEGIYKEKGSKFLAFAFPVASEQDVRQHLDAIKRQYFDARHHCYAWALGPERQQHRISDDGEPNHSAGDPIFGQIRSRNLTDTLVVVVRYFGGVKLGVGGLIHAYRAAAEEALINNTVIEREIVSRVEVAFDFASTSEVMRLVKDFDLKIIAQHYDDSCRIDAEVSARHVAQFGAKVQLLSAMGVRIFLTDK